MPLRGCVGRTGFEVPNHPRQEYKTPRMGRLIFWRRGWDSARSLRELPANMPLRGCVGRTGFEVLNHTRRENKTAPRGGHLIFWRRGWDSARSLRELPANMPLRGCVGRTGFEVLNHTRRENKMAPRGGHLIFWRRGWDSNPRYGRTVHLISNQAHSTTLAPLHNSNPYSCRRPLDVSTPDLTRHLWWLALRAHFVRPKRLRRLVESGPFDHSGTSP